MDPFRTFLQLCPRLISGCKVVCNDVRNVHEAILLVNTWNQAEATSPKQDYTTVQGNGNQSSKLPPCSTIIRFSSWSGKQVRPVIQKLRPEKILLPSPAAGGHWGGGVRGG